VCKIWHVAGRLFNDKSETRLSLAHLHRCVDTEEPTRWICPRRLRPLLQHRPCSTPSRLHPFFQHRIRLHRLHLHLRRLHQPHLHLLGLPRLRLPRLHLHRLLLHRRHLHQLRPHRLHLHLRRLLMADQREASDLQAIDGNETVGNSAAGSSASAVASDAALTAGLAEFAPLLNVPSLSKTPKVNVDDNTRKSSVQQKKKGARSQQKHNDHLTEALKEEVDKCSPKEGDRDVESGCISEAGLQHLKNICEILFKKKREFSSVHQLCQFAARLGSKWYFQVSRYGYKVTCHYAPPTKKYMQVSPGRQRKIKESLKSLVQCPWEIKCSPLERGTGKDSSEIAVKI
jgi:hypothetical protein